MTIFFTISNLVFIVLWIGFWRSTAESDSFFNPYVMYLRQLSNRITDFLKPILPWFDSRSRAMIALLFLLVFRASLLYNTSGPISLTLTSSVVDSSALGGGATELRLYAALFDQTSFLACIGYSLLSFLYTLFVVFVIHFIYGLFPERRDILPVSQTLEAICGPRVPRSHALRAIQVIVLGCCLVLLASRWGTPMPGGIYPGANASVAHDGANADATAAAMPVLRLLLATAATIVGAIEKLYGILITLIITSLVAALTGRIGLLKTIHHLISFLLGPLSKRPFRFGGFDLSPIIFLFLLMISIQILTAWIYALAQAL